MDRRVYDMATLYNQENRSNTRFMSNDCIDDDFCVSAPHDMNNGILTMAFVDMQPLDEVYSLQDAFCNGTLFPNLNKPFYGGKK